jgi:hypothetical protein
MALKLSTSLRNALMDAITTAVGNGGKLDIYDGSRPASPQVAVGAQVKLAEFVCGTPFAPASSAGVLSPTIPAQVNALATSTATWFRQYKSDGTTAVIDGDVGTAGADLNLNTASIVSGGPVVINSWTITAPNA